MVGWSALVHSLGVAAPVRGPSCVSQRHVLGSKRNDGIWNIYDKRYRPESTLEGHLTFAMRHETIDLLVLKRILQAVPETALVEMIRAKPRGITARRIWFFFETLTGKRLDIPDTPAATAVDALDPDRYYTGEWMISRRHRVRNNLLGTGELCPVIRRTPKLEKMIALDLPAKTRDTIGKARARNSSRTPRTSYYLKTAGQALRSRGNVRRLTGSSGGGMRLWKRGKGPSAKRKFTVSTAS